MSRPVVESEQLVLDIAEWAAALPDDDQVHVDSRCGHIRIGEVIFADLGPTLRLWSYLGHSFTPQSADALGRALRAWAQTATGRHEPSNDEAQEGT